MSTQDHVVDAEDHEADQGDDLEDQAGERDVDADLGSAVRCGRHATADRLENESNDITRDEGVIYRCWRDSRHLGGVVSDAIHGLA